MQHSLAWQSIIYASVTLACSDLDQASRIAVVAAAAAVVVASIIAVSIIVVVAAVYFAVLQLCE